MAENVRKLGLYLRSPDSYHAASDPSVENLVVRTAPLGRYYLDQTVPLDFGHWGHFDDLGMPQSMSRGGEGYAHDHNTIVGYALGHWDKYLLTGDERHWKIVLDCCSYTFATVDRTDDTCWKLRFEPRPGAGHIGGVSGLDHGQWLSLLCRVWQVSGDDKYLDLAVRLLALFEIPISAEGALSYIDAEGRVPWYEEAETDEDFHILNGMQITLWGMLDLYLVSGHEKARRMWETGVESLEVALPLFDTGYWSWYGVSNHRPNYMASMKYHSLHIVALEILADQTESSTIRDHANLFADYAAFVPNRLRSGVQLAIDKLRMRRLEGS